MITKHSVWNFGDQTLRVTDIRSSMVPGCLHRHVAFVMVPSDRIDSAGAVLHNNQIDYTGVIPYKMMEKLIEQNIITPK